MPKLIKQDRGNYTNISNKLARDSRLTWKARGIFLYLWSQANEWQFYVKEVATHATDGERSLRNGLKELEEQGYLKRIHSHSKTGSFDGMEWVLSDVADVNHHAQNSNDGEKAENTAKKVQNASDAKRIRCKMHPMQNSSLRNNNSKNYQYEELSRVRKKHEQSSLTVSELSKEFEQLWAKYPNKKGKKQAFDHYKHWRKEAPATHTSEYMMQKLEGYLNYIKANHIKPRYIMYGSTWFNGRFEDELKVDKPDDKPKDMGFPDANKPIDDSDIPDDLPF